jgi:molybdate transport system substrate-binding protein
MRKVAAELARFLIAMMMGEGVIVSQAPAADDLAGKVVVSAAASTVDALEELEAKFERIHPKVDVELSFLASSTAAKQIAAGSPADLFLSASDDWADFLEKNNRVAKRRELLGNRLAIVTAKDSPLKIERAEDLAGKPIRAIALADPDAVPAGIYARQALEKLKLWETVKDKYVGAANVRQAMQFVESGAAEVAIVYQTDAQASKKLKAAVRLDTKLSAPIRYPMVLLKSASDNRAAAAFYEYLSSTDAEQTFRDRGFLVGKDLRPDTSAKSPTSAGR